MLSLIFCKKSRKRISKSILISAYISMQKIAFFINPRIRNFRSIEIELQHHFIDLDYQFFISEYHGHLLTLPQKAISEGFNYLIAVGGDGTLNEMINGVINSFKTENSYDWQKILKLK